MELTLDQALHKGIEAHKAGKVQEADKYYTAILQAQPKHPDANHNMGVLAVGVGKVEQALPFFKTALEANPSIDQFWLSYIDALIKLEKLADAKAILDQAKSAGAKGDAFDRLEKRLTSLLVETKENVKGQNEDNILNTFKLDQAIRLAEKKAKEGSSKEAKRIYLDILEKFPKNKKALDGIAALANRNLANKSDMQEPPNDHLQKLANLYTRGQYLTVQTQASQLLKKFPNSANLYNIIGLTSKSLGKLNEATEAYTKALSIKPDYAEASYNMGIAFQGQGKLEQAIEAYKKALSIKSDFVDAYYNIGVALQNQGKLDEAKDSYTKALTIKPDYAEAYNNLGLTLQGQDKLDDAINAYRKTISIKPDYAEAYYNMGNTLQEQGEPQEAIEAFNKALSIKPQYAEAYYNIGIILESQSKLDEAVEAYFKALSIKPNYAEAYNNMGNAVKNQGKLDEAVEAYSKALSIKPNYAEACYNIGNAFKDQGKLVEAIEAYNKALSIKPDSADTYNNMGNAIQGQGKLDEAIKAYNKALTLKPDSAEVHKNLGFAFLKIGKLKEGLDKFEWRWKTHESSSSARKFSQPLWDGKESLKGKTILLWSEQGIGDTINWSSCLSFVAAQAEHCILECPQKLVPLLERSFPSVEFKPEDRSLDPQRDDFDYHLPMGSLFRHFISKIPPHSKGDAFLIPDPARVKFWQKRLNSIGNGPYIGIGWKSSNMSPQRMPNYASISDFAPIFEIPDATFINMQYNDFKDDLTKIQNEMGVKVHNFDDLDQFENLEDVAALCAALDIVVSTHNVLIMIAPRVGTLTKFASWQQSPWNNILLSPNGPAIDKFDRNTWEPWENIFRSIAEDIINNNLED